MTNLVQIVGGTLLMAAYGIVAGLVFLGVDRVLAARMQARIGPPLHQPFIDFFKLLSKENIVPDNAVARLFNLAPVLTLASSIALLLYVPLGSWGPILTHHGDLILILYLLMVPALAMVAGGFASTSPYATIGAQREMVTMISYELPLATVVIALAWRLDRAGVDMPFSLSAINDHPIWNLLGPIGVVGGALLLLTLLIVTPAELSRIPFDTPEAETELAGGLLVEYSGRNLALFYLALGVKTIAMVSLVVTLFFPYPLSGLLALSGISGQIADAIFHIFKMFVVMFFSVTLIRISIARFRITQVASFYWKALGSIGVIGLLLIMVDAWIGRGGAP